MTDQATTTQGALAAYQIPDDRLAELRTKVERLARRAVKLKMAPLVLREVHADARKRRVPSEDGGPPRIAILPCTWCELEGASPVVAGYTFLARVEHTEAGNLVSRAPGSDEVDLVAYRSAPPTCDHCKSKRKRADTFVLRGPDGALKQIGRNCLADYLRSENAEVVVAIMALTYELSQLSGENDDDDDGGEGGGGRWRTVLLVADYMAAVAAAVRQKGWVSRGAARAYEEASGGVAGKETTAEFASFISGPAPKDARAYEYWRGVQPTEADAERATVVLAWLLGTTDASDYMYNLRTAAKQPEVTHRTRGLLASAVSAYAREVEKIEAVKRGPKVDAGFFGEEKKRYDLKGTVTFVREIPGFREGTVKTIVGFESADGHRFTWFASGYRDVEAGDVVEMRGTVKKHEMYKGRHQTLLTRCEFTKVVSRKDAQKEAC